eukprot:827428-Amphidinium_carterae.1
MELARWAGVQANIVRDCNVQLPGEDKQKEKLQASEGAIAAARELLAQGGAHYAVGILLCGG